MGRIKIEHAFLALAFVMSVVLALLVVGIIQNRHIIRDTRRTATRAARTSVDVAELRRAEADSCKNYETLRAALNEFHSAFRGLLIAARNARERSSSPADRATAATYNKLIGSIHTVSATCAQKHHGRRRSRDSP